MRTTFLLSSLLFLAGSALAQQDSPITVGDSSQFPPAQKKAGTTGHSILLQHKQFQSNGANDYVDDKGLAAACLEMVGAPPPPVPLPKTWNLTLNDNVELKSVNGQRIDIDYKGKTPVPHNPTTGDQQREIVGDQLTSVGLSVDHGKPTTYPPSGTPPSSQNFIIHYCPKGDCKDPKTGSDPCNPTVRK